MKAIRSIATTFRIISTVIFLLAPQQGFSQISESEDSTTQEDNSKANLLFKQAITLHAGALSADGHEQNQLYREVLSILDVIAESYPNSIPGRSIMLGKPLGPINIKALRASVGQLEALEPLMLEETGPSKDVWRFLGKPSKELSVGQSALGFVLHTIGYATYEGLPFFPSASDTHEATTLKIFLSPNQKQAVAVFWDADVGGLRAGLVDLVSGRILNASIIPDNRVLGLTAPEHALLVAIPSVSWSPNGSLGAISVSAAEWESHVILFSNETGETEELAPQESSNQFAQANLESVKWAGLDKITVEFVSYRCGDPEVCEAPVLVGSQNVEFKTLLPRLQSSVGDLIPLDATQMIIQEPENRPPEETAVAEGEKIHEPEATLQPTAEWYERIVTGGRIGSGYGHGEFPSWGQRTHAGVDIGGGCKLDVHAAAQGTVTHIINASDRDFDSVGNAVIIEHGSIGGRSTYTVYFHMAEAPLVQLGPVAKGAKLGVTGDTGAADGCHLHFEVRHFEGLYNPGWSNIYGLGNWADDPYFKTNWSDPEGWFKAQADPMLKRFETECQDADITDAPLACPFEEENTCIGEGCFKAGLAVTNGNIVFVESPGSDLEVFRTQQNEFLIYEESRVFSIPCRVRVLQSAVAELKTGTEVFRLSYLGEGAYRFFTDGKVISGANGDEFSLNSDCEKKSEQWVRMRNRSGQSGWVHLLAGANSFLGLSIHDNIESEPPKWTWKELPSGTADNYLFRGTGGLCDVTGLPLYSEEIAEKFLDARMSIGTTTRSSGRYWISRKTNNTGSYIYSLRNGEQTTGEIRIVNDMFCQKAEGDSTENCAVVRRCNDNISSPFVFQSSTGDDISMVSDFEQRGDIKLAQAAELRADFPDDIPLVSNDMVGFDYDFFQPCIDYSTPEAYSENCLMSAGIPAPIAIKYARLASIVNMDVIVQKVTDIGPIQIARLYFPILANSNYQDMVFAGTVQVKDFLDGNPRMLNSSSDRVARQIRRKYPEAFIDGSGGGITYLKMRGLTPVLYKTYPILNGCRACDVVGSVTVAGSISGYFVDAKPIIWTRETNDSWLSGGGTKTDTLSFYQLQPRELQYSLSASGYDTGGIDGKLGPRTRNALRDFQHEHCLQPTGIVNSRTAKALWNRRELWGGCYEQY